MPSPFPGMDPYLEEPVRWPDVHHGIISELQSHLNRDIRPRYYVRIEVRVIRLEIDDPAQALFRISDLQVVTDRLDVPPRRRARAAVAAGVATAVEIDTTDYEFEVKQARLKIHESDSKRLVTVLEVLSPTNKATGSEARVSYLDKRQEAYEAGCHFVEIDLLRRGKPTFPRGKACHYAVHVSRAERRPLATVWRIDLPQRLPVVGVPLLAGDADAEVDLQAVLNSTYERGAYDADTDYTLDPVPPLSPADARWADALLRKAGLRLARKRR